MASFSEIIGYAVYVLIAVLVLLAMITVHELGHYISGKIFGFGIEEFAIGFGPKLYSKTKKDGEKFSIRLLPLGGFCAFKGEDQEDSDPTAFNNKKPWQRLIVLLSGAFMNYVFSLLIIALMFGIYGHSALVAYKVDQTPSIYGEEYQLTDLDPALVSRFNIYEFKPTVEEWLNWAVANKLDNRVVNFIQDNPTWLDGDTNDKKKNAYQGLDKSADRRAWKKVSDIMLNVGIIKDIHKKIIAGIIGAAATAAFVRSAQQNNTITGKDLLTKYDKTIKNIEKYQLHEFAILNESIFRFLNNAKFNERENKLISENLAKYIDWLRINKQKEALANFTTIFEKGTYEQAIVFMVVNAKEVYDMLTDFVEKL